MDEESIVCTQCKPEKWIRFYQKDLPQKQLRQMEAHLNTCRDCQQLWSDVKAFYKDQSNDNGMPAQQLSLSFKVWLQLIWKQIQLSPKFINHQLQTIWAFSPLKKLRKWRFVPVSLSILGVLLVGVWLNYNKAISIEDQTKELATVSQVNTVEKAVPNCIEEIKNHVFQFSPAAEHMTASAQEYVDPGRLIVYAVGQAYEVDGEPYQ